MDNTKIKLKLDENLNKILDLIYTNELEKQEILKEYDRLVIEQLMELLLNKFANDNEVAEMAKILKENANLEAVDSSVKIKEFMDARLTQDEKDEMYLASKINVFLEILSAIVETTTDEKLVEIEKILSEDEAFYKLYKTLKTPSDNKSDTPVTP